MANNRIEKSHIGIYCTFRKMAVDNGSHTKAAEFIGIQPGLKLVKFGGTDFIMKTYDGT